VQLRNQLNNIKTGIEAGFASVDGKLELLMREIGEMRDSKHQARQSQGKIY